LSLSSEKLVSEFAFKWVNLYRYTKAEGNFLDLTSSQAIPDTLGADPAPADDDGDSSPPAPPAKSLLDRHAATLLPALLRGVLDVSKAEKCNVLHATLREAAVAALECDAVWKLNEENDDLENDAHGILRELTAHVVWVSPSRSPIALRQNIALVIKLTRRLMDAAVAAAEARGADAAGLDAAAAAALQPMLEAGLYKLNPVLPVA
jgi:hypothetical protein